MTIKSKPFPPLVDMHSATWDLYAPEANLQIALRNNQIVERLAIEKIELGDHIYGFPPMPINNHGRTT